MPLQILKINSPATTELNKSTVNLVGLAQTGIEFTPAG